MSPEIQQFESLLKTNGHFVTKPRLRLFEQLQKHPEPTIKKLIGLLGDYDQATVYRNLLVFEDLGIIQRLRLGWHSKVELSDLFHVHHHHATCTNCGKLTPLEEDAPMEAKIRQLARQNNFQISSHSLEIRGLCPACRA